MSKRVCMIWCLGVILTSMSLTRGPAFSANSDTGLTVTFVSRGPQPRPKDLAKGDVHAVSLTGHVFIIVGVRTNSGVKEDVFGFYPQSDTLRGVIKGPGMLKPEYRCNPNDCNPKEELKLLKRLSESDESVTISITPKQRLRLFQDINIWNSKEYRLTDQNCEDFIGTVAHDLGYPVPARSPTQKPVDYLGALRSMIELEDSRREAAAAKIRQQNAEQAAQKAEERQQQAEQAAKAAEQRQQQAEQTAKAAAEKGSCLNGTWREQYENPFSWTFTVVGDRLTIARLDHRLYGTLTRQGSNWSGTLYSNGQPGGIITLTPSSDCSSIGTNQRWSYRR